MELLAIRPGMTILDIGAGTGQFAYEFARRLNGTGKVFATDTQGRCIDYMKGEAERRGFGNLHPVLVGQEGVDAFYGRQRYDLIAVFHVYLNFEDRIDYFRELKGLLAEGGRLVLILYKTPTLFSTGDFAGDSRGLVRELLSEPAETPFFGILSDSTRKLLRDNPEAEPSESLRKAIAEDFNRALPDARFTARFHQGSAYRKQARFLPEERRHADWLLLPFRDESALAIGSQVQGELGYRMFGSINKLLILQRYRPFLKPDGLFASGFTPRIRAVFEKAGYRILREYPDAVPFEDMIVLSAR